MVDGKTCGAGGPDESARRNLGGGRLPSESEAKCPTVAEVPEPMPGQAIADESVHADPEAVSGSRGQLRANHPKRTIERQRPIATPHEQTEASRTNMSEQNRVERSALERADRFKEVSANFRKREAAHAVSERK